MFSSDGMDGINMFSSDGRYEMDAERRIAAGTRVKGALAALMTRRNVSTAARLAVLNAVLVPYRQIRLSQGFLTKKKKTYSAN